jgi:hypothetical protein
VANPGVTYEQWQDCTSALAMHGTKAEAAKVLGLPYETFRSRLASGNTRFAGRAGVDGSAPDGYMVKGRSTLYGPDGEIKAEWVKTTADRERLQEMFKAAVDEMAKDLPRVRPIKAPVVDADDLLVVLPVGDHHLGQYSWHEETGDDYDLDIGERLLVGATKDLLNAVPKAGTCVIAFMGDFMDYDSWEAVTPTSRNLMDADGRFPKMVRAAIRCMRHMIEAAAKQFAKVHVIVEIGNHDLASSIFLMECMANIYADNPRITVDTSPRHFHYYEFGVNAIGTHHGHGVKMKDLPLLMATDNPDMWGRTKHRIFWVGHVHHKDTKAKDHTGCAVETLRVLGPRSAWADQRGFRSPREMIAVVYHREFGERTRITVNPDMLTSNVGRAVDSVA